jgi:prepilin-type N-terminal cleavage/methylation domain-containing protein
MKRQGFTLIELMVVIVIIGVLASLAIPKFTEASAKAKMAEAPRVMASYESAYSAAQAELGSVASADQLIFKIPSSTWFTYSYEKGDLPGSAVAGDEEPDVIKKLNAKAKSGMGVFKADMTISTEYNPTNDEFEHGADTKEAEDAAKKLIPNFNAAFEKCGAKFDDDNDNTTPDKECVLPKGHAKAAHSAGS